MISEVLQPAILTGLHEGHPGIVAPLHPWVFPDHPWSRLYIDYTGPIVGKMILVIMDAHTKWINVHVSSGSTSTITISGLRNCFSTHGIPDAIVSDNATCFTSDEFKHFCHMNGIRCIASAPHHPSSSGMAERAVEVVKDGGWWPAHKAQLLPVLLQGYPPFHNWDCPSWIADGSSVKNQVAFGEAKPES